MKIGIDARLWSQTGVGRYIRSLVVQLLTIDKKNSYVIFVMAKDRERIFHELDKTENKNWDIVVADFHWHSLAEQLKFPNTLYSHNLDLMHFTYFSVPIFYSRPFVMTIHDLIPYHLSTGKASTLPYPVYAAKKFGYKVVLQRSTRTSRKIIVPLQAIKQDVMQTLRIDSDKIVVTTEGFDMVNRVGPATIKSEEFGDYFLYVGNAYPHKNIEMLVGGFRKFHASNKGIRLILVGRKDFFYKRLQAELTPSDKKLMTFLFDVSDSDLVQLYKNAIGLVSASKMEGFGLTPLEAMSFGCIPIVSDIPSFREVCQDAALYFDPNSSDDIASKLLEVQNMNGVLKKEFHSRAKNRILHFSWKNTAHETLKIYESCYSVRSGK